MTRSDSIAKLIPALIAAQRAMGPALKTAVNPHYKSRYVDLEGALEACREALWVNGLTVVQTTAVGGEGGARLVTLLAHVSGEWIAGEYPLRPVRDDPQGLGAALTYARRYALMAIVGLAPEDDDGQAASRPARAPERVRNPGEDDGPVPGPVSMPEADRQPPHGQRAQTHHGCPRDGKALYRWARDQAETTGEDVVKWLQSLGKVKHYPPRMVDWTADQVALGWDAACRKLQSQGSPSNGTHA